jgi:anti-sigma factor RsiW
VSDPANDLLHERLRHDLGAYVLGQLDPARAVEVEDHLPTCPECRGEHDELVPVAAALADLRADASPAPLDAPAGLEGRILEAIGTEQRARSRTRWRPILSAVAGAAAAAAVLIGTYAVTRPEPPPLEAVAVQVETPGVDATADLVPHTWGVEVRLHASGFTAGERYRVVVVGTDGRAYDAGEFVGVDGAMDCNLNSSVLRADATGFRVQDASGDTVVASTF